MIDFASIPVRLRTPGSYIEFDSTRALAGLPSIANRALLIGQSTDTGSGATLVPHRISSADEARVLFGRGSQLATMAAVFFSNDSASEVSALALVDPLPGAAATATITVTGPATVSGTIALSIAGRRVSIAAVAGQTATELAASLRLAINRNLDMPVHCTVAENVLTLRARVIGTTGNAIQVRAGERPGDRLPPGVALAITDMAGGAGEPDHGLAWTAIGDTPFRTVVLPTADPGALDAAEAELDRRWGPTVMIETVAYAARGGTVGELAAFGETRNSQLVSILDLGGTATTPWEVAAAYGATVGLHGAIDPARPFHTLPLAGVAAPAEIRRRTRADREALLSDGLSTAVTTSDDTVLIERAITTFRVNAQGVEDESYLDLNTVLTLGYIRQAVRARIAAKYPRHKLADDNALYAAGASVVTPAVLRAELIALMREMEERGLVERVDRFVAELIVERDTGDPNRVNALVPPDLVNGLRTFAAKVEFRR